MPSPTNKAFFQGSGECIVDFAEAAAWQIDLAGGPVKIVDGGNLTVYDWFILGYAEGDVGELAGRVEVYDGGVLDCMVRLKVGFQGEGHLTVYEGGTVNIHTKEFDVGEHIGGTGSGFVELEGGSINLFEGTNPVQGLDLYRGEASIDFLGGVLTLPDTTENKDILNRAISDGIIKAYDGVGEVVIHLIGCGPPGYLDRRMLNFKLDYFTWLQHRQGDCIFMIKHQSMHCLPSELYIQGR